MTSHARNVAMLTAFSQDTYTSLITPLAAAGTSPVTFVEPVASVANSSPKNPSAGIGAYLAIMSIGLYIPPVSTVAT